MVHVREAKAWLRNLTWDDLTRLGQREPALAGLSRALGQRVRAARGPRVGDKPFAHPHYWAAFVPTGDPR